MATKKKTSKAKVILISILALILGVLLGYAFANVYNPNDFEFYLEGGNTISLGIDSEYEEKGVVCNYKGTDYSSEVVITYYNEDKVKCNTINTKEITTYYVTYDINVKKISASLTRVVNVVDVEDLEINFMMLGNKYAGDCIYIKAGDVDILVDAGSRVESAPTITNYLKDSNSNLHSYVSDNKLEYVIVTHADRDHIAAFTGTNGILSTFDIETIIEFPQTNSTSATYKSYRSLVNELEKEGTNVYTALECYNNQNGASRVIELAAGIELEILYNYYYDHSTDNENNYSVCFMLRRAEEQFLFTGDLENDGKAEERLVQYNKLGEVYLYKMGHHGSKTSSSMALLNEIKPKVAIATCAAFVEEYTKDTNNTFPTKAAIDNLNAIGTVEHLYVPSMVSNNSQGYEPANGDIVVYANSNGTGVKCSHSNEDFYTFDIFKQFRSWTVK